MRFDLEYNEDIVDANDFSEIDSERGSDFFVHSGIQMLCQFIYKNNKLLFITIILLNIMISLFNTLF